MIETSNEFFDIEATLKCGQVFRFSEHKDGFKVISTDKCCYIYEKGNRVIIDTPYEQYFFRYFDLGRDYKAVFNDLMCFEELKPLALLAKGIHILRQDPFETIISFIISANNNIKRIKGIIDRLSTLFGQNLGDYHAFPTLEQLLPLNEQDFINLGAGYRANYIFSALNTLNGCDLLDEIVKMDYPNAIEALMKLKGVGRKVADCIALFALGHTDCYPTDTNIFKHDKNESTTKTLAKIEQVRSAGINRYGRLAGFAQQWKFYAQIITKK